MKRLLCAVIISAGLIKVGCATTPAQLQTSINGINWNQSDGLVSTLQVEGLFNQIVGVFNSGVPLSGLTGLGTGVATLLGGAASGTGGPIGSASPTISSPTITGFTANLPLIGGGAGAVVSGSRSGSTTDFATVIGSLISGHCVSIDGSGNLIDAGGACTVGGGGGTVSAGSSGNLGYYSTSGTVISPLTLGSGVLTALGVNVGSAGAPVLFNGAGGAPTGLTLTNATGLPVSTGISGLGAGVGTLLGSASTGTGGPVGSASPTLTGTPAAPTAAFGANTTQLATMAALQAAVAVPTNKLAYVVSPTSGVKCDGSTNDTTALNAFFASVAANTTIEFPGGAACIFQGQLTFPNVNYLVWHGNGSTLKYTGATTTGNLVSAGVTGGSGGGGADCSFTNWIIQDLTVATSTVMTAGDGFVLNDPCSLFVRGLIVGQGLNGNNNFYNGFHLNGGNELYINQFHFRGSHAGEVINGDGAGAGSIQLTDAFHQLGDIANGSGYGLWVAGNCGGCQWDNMDVVGNATNVRIDQGITAIQNRQVRFGPGFASDGTSASPNLGIDIQDAGASGTQLFVEGSWISTASATCLNIASGVTWEIHLVGARIENCTANGILNASANVRLLIDGGAIAQNGTGINNTATLPHIQIQARPAMYGNTTNEIGMTPTIASGCGVGSGSPAVSGDDYDFLVTLGTTSATNCILNLALAHDRQADSVSETMFAAAAFANVGTSSGTQISANFSAALTSGGLFVHASGTGY
jgi:hypothetical protein